VEKVVFDEPEKGDTGGAGLMLYRRDEGHKKESEGNKREEAKRREEAYKREEGNRREEAPRLYNREPVNGGARAGEQGGERMMQQQQQGRASFGRAEVGGKQIVLFSKFRFSFPDSQQTYECNAMPGITTSLSSINRS
jgi:hypothetical protein